MAAISSLLSKMASLFDVFGNGTLFVHHLSIKAWYTMKTRRLGYHEISMLEALLLLSTSTLQHHQIPWRLGQIRIIIQTTISSSSSSSITLSQDATNNHQQTFSFTMRKAHPACWHYKQMMIHALYLQSRPWFGNHYSRTILSTKNKCDPMKSVVVLYFGGWVSLLLQPVFSLP